MKATSKQEFFELLGYELNRIGIEDTAEIFADFEEHFADGAMRGLPEGETAESLGDIKEIARSYLNLESSRLNSIMARDVERKRVSLTKPGYSVPADLSLAKNDGSQNIQDILNSDNIRSITPEHISSEVYPEAPTSTGANPQSAYSQPTGSQNVYGTTSTEQATSDNVGGTSAQSTTASGEKSVGEAFSEAGRAAVDAAKVTGHAIAEAFSNGKVKTAVSEAGKTAAEAVKSASKSAQDAINKAKAEHKSKHEEKSNAQYSDKYAEDVAPTAEQSTTYTAEQPKKYTKISDFNGMKADINRGKLVLAIMLDVFLWSWLLPMLASLIISAFGGSVGILLGSPVEAFNSGYNIISEIFLCVALASLGGILICISVQFVKLFIKLVKFVIVLHYKAVYNVD